MPVNKGRLARSLVIGSASSLVVILLTTCLISGIMMMLTSLPKSALPYIMLAPCALGTFIGGWISAAMNGSKGIIVGLSCGMIVFLILLIIGLAKGGEDMGAVLFIRAGVLALFGILGGIKGVNRKEKLHIK